MTLIAGMRRPDATRANDNRTMAKPPAISVVVPTKGRLVLLRRCLEALVVCDPESGPFEVVVVNDSGSVEVDALAASFEDRVRVITVASPRAGPSAARNAGAAAASGAYIAFTDDDCEPDPGWVAALVRTLELNPGAAVGGRVVNGCPQSAGAVATQLVVETLQASLGHPGKPRFFPSSNLAFPTEAFRVAGGFDEAFPYAEDRELCERWSRLGRRLVSAPDAVVMHMRHLEARDFLSQHFGYGRGARAYRRRWPDRPDGDGGREFIRKLGRRAAGVQRRRGAIAAYLVASQLATAAGFAREAALARDDDADPAER